MTGQIAPNPINMRNRKEDRENPHRGLHFFFSVAPLQDWEDRKAQGNRLKDQPPRSDSLPGVNRFAAEPELASASAFIC